MKFKIQTTFKHLKFHTKLLFTYSIFIITIFILVAVLFYSYASKILEDNIKESFYQNSVTISKQLDLQIKEMENAANRVVNNSEIKEYLNWFKNNKNSDLSVAFIYGRIRSILEFLFQTEPELYRGSVILLDGDFVSSRYTTYQGKEKIKNLIWIEEMLKSPDSKHVLSAHYDPWIQDKYILVYSVIKAIKNDKGETIGFVEVQKRYDTLPQIIQSISDDSLVAIIRDSREVFYSNEKLTDKAQIKHYIDISQNPGSEVAFIKNPFSKVEEIVAYTKSEDNGWTTFVIQNKDLLTSSLEEVRSIIFVSIIIIIIISVFYIAVFSKRLTLPLTQLKNKIESVNMNNLLEDSFIDDIKIDANEEIKAIDNSFMDMQQRLKNAMEREIRSRSLQAKAYFDALQAKINPHFIFNMLGVIANLCEEADQEEIAGVCRRFAKILRYSTTASDSFTTMKEEMEHAEDYLSLMKTRYEHRLEYKVSMDDDVSSAILPKFIIQPLIENSFNHGFKTVYVPVMEINVCANKNGEVWEIVIKDNGSGFDNEVINNLDMKIKEYEEMLFKYQKPDELSIGGMGITNTFVRLRLLFAGNIKFSIGNDAQGGAIIRISGPIITSLEGRKNV
ncbi:MAG: cache domain-containing sensor histidine kinase [Acetivibrionales bacterium]